MFQRNLQGCLRAVRYNEFVGCIEVHRVGWQLRADRWYSRKKRIVIGFHEKGTVHWSGKLLEKGYNGSTLSSRNFEDFRSALTAAIRRDPQFRRRWVDFTAFDRTGPYVDWRAIFNL